MTFRLTRAIIVIVVAAVSKTGRSSYGNGPVVQLVRTLACHARGRGFEPLPGRQFSFQCMVYQTDTNLYASVAQSVEQGTENPCVGGSIPPGGTIYTNNLYQFDTVLIGRPSSIMREWLSGRASPCQGERRGFESRLPLQVKKTHNTLCVFFTQILYGAIAKR